MGVGMRPGGSKAGVTLENTCNSECERCLWEQPAPSQPGRKVLEHLQRPLLGAEETPEASPVQMRKEQERKKNRARGHLYPLTTSTPKKGGNPRLGHSLVKQENVRPRWVLLYPTHCPVVKGKSMAL